MSSESTAASSKLVQSDRPARPSEVQRLGVATCMEPRSDSAYTSGHHRKVNGVATSTMIKRAKKKASTRASRADPVLMEVLNDFRRIMRALRIAAGETQARFQISAAQLFVLDELYEAGGPRSINELAELTMTDRSSVAEVVERLVESGYATREQSVHDRRRADVQITAAGERLARSAPPPPGLRLLTALRKLSPTELHALARVLGRLQQEMDLTQEPAPMLFNDRPKRRPGRVRRT
jgi:DNA-binding MarR family transcriptional regulator